MYGCTGCNSMAQHSWHLISGSDPMPSLFLHRSSARFRELIAPAPQEGASCSKRGLLRNFAKPKQRTQIAEDKYQMPKYDGLAQHFHGEDFAEDNVICEELTIIVSFAEDNIMCEELIIIVSLSRIGAGSARTRMLSLQPTRDSHIQLTVRDNGRW